LIYLVGIVLLFIPIIALGLPAAPSRDVREASPGGILAQERVKNNLGETSLGNVDPTSATMNLVLLGLRGVATSILWKQAHDEQDVKNWAALRATTDSIILLQPHFLKVWEFHGWNLAYNVAPEWDAVGDRYYWVKEGIKFKTRGAERNERYPDLYYQTGIVVAQKIGLADERKQYRRFFRDQDPDILTFRGGPDPSVKRVPGRPDGENLNLNADNYEVGREWFKLAVQINDKYPGHEQHILAAPLFRATPTRTMMEHATAMQDEGIFDERTRRAWADAFEEWTTKYGKEEFLTLENPTPLHMEVTPAEANELSKTPAGQRTIHWIAAYQDIVNYRYWRQRCQAEQEPLTVEAHRDLYNGREKYFESHFGEATKNLLSGMTKLEQVLQKHPEMFGDDSFTEEGLVAQVFWRSILKLQAETVPEKYPLQRLWESFPGMHEKATEEFHRYGRQRELQRSLENRN
jgi:hypothetical protein